MGDEDSATFVDNNRDLGKDALSRIGYDGDRLAHPKARTMGLLPRTL